MADDPIQHARDLIEADELVAPLGLLVINVSSAGLTARINKTPETILYFGGKEWKWLKEQLK